MSSIIIIESTRDLSNIMVLNQKRRQRIRRLPTDPPCKSVAAKSDRWGEAFGKSGGIAKRKVVRFALDRQRKPLCTVYEIPCRHHHNRTDEPEEHNGKDLDEKDLLWWDNLELSPQGSKTKVHVVTKEDLVEGKLQEQLDWFYAQSLISDQPEDTSTNGIKHGNWLVCPERQMSA